uniref:Uncharacterized protein n=1 Tax=Helianthus annuus TaxID=4232 RepID=A0A251S1J5_HELAN
MFLVLISSTQRSQSLTGMAIKGRFFFNVNPNLSVISISCVLMPPSIFQSNL